MTQAHVDLLLQSLRECCDDLQQRHKDFLELWDHSNFSTSRLYVKGIAGQLKETAADLREWCNKFEKKKNIYQEQRYRKDVNKTVELCDWIKEISVHIIQLVEDASQANRTQAQT